MEINFLCESLDTIFELLDKYATWLNIKGRTLCFIIWMICNFYWIIIDLHRHLYAQTFFIIISTLFYIWGFVKWKRDN